jgi:hypothetical protein
MFRIQEIAITATLFCIMTPCIIDAQVVVHDPLNGVQLATQVEKSVQIIQNDIKIAQAAQQNLTRPQTAWTDIQARLLNLQAMAASGRKTGNFSAAAANAQISQIGTEFADMTKWQNAAKNATGSLQAQGANAGLQSEIATQIAELRQLTLAEKMDEQAALQRYHAPATDPSKY